MGLTQEVWDFLANEMDTVFHNGATVNYLFNYDRMRDANVLGTNEVLRLAFEGRPKSFNYVSTTFVFGWAVKKVLYETDHEREYGASRFRIQPVQMGSGTGGATRAARGLPRGFSGPLW
jgi:thioester reductase-like protein